MPLSTTVVYTPNAAWLVRQHRFDDEIDAHRLHPREAMFGLQRAHVIGDGAGLVGGVSHKCESLELPGDPHTRTVGVAVRG
jgi:hypothetical protein